MSPAPLLNAAELSTLQQTVLRRHTSQRAAGAAPHTGALTTRWRGLGMELFESRPYRAGDDPRHLDWRATARHGRPISKVFRAEKQRANFIVTDRGVSMAFGTRRQLKAALAARVAAILTFSALADHEHIGGAVVASRVDLHSGGRSLDAVVPLLNALSAPLDAAASTSTLSATLWRTIAHATPSHTHVYVISDFQRLDADGIRDLAQLATTHTITALVVSDPAEEHLADVGWLRVMSPLSGNTGVINTGDASVREQYAAQRAQAHAALVRTLRNVGVETYTLSTAHEAYAQLQALPL